MPSRASTGGVLRWSGLEKASPSAHSHDDRFGQRLATTARALGLRVLLRKVRRQPQGISENGNSNGLVVVTVYHLAGSPHGDFVEFFHGEFERKLTKPELRFLQVSSQKIIRIPFRRWQCAKGVNVFVSFSRFGIAPLMSNMPRPSPILFPSGNDPGSLKDRPSYCC